MEPFYWVAQTNSFTHNSKLLHPHSTKPKRSVPIKKRPSLPTVPILCPYSRQRCLGMLLSTVFCSHMFPSSRTSFSLPVTPSIPLPRLSFFSGVIPHTLFHHSPPYDVIHLSLLKFQFPPHHTSTQTRLCIYYSDYPPIISDSKYEGMALSVVVGPCYTLINVFYQSTELKRCDGGAPLSLNIHGAHLSRSNIVGAHVAQ